MRRFALVLAAALLLPSLAQAGPRMSSVNAYFATLTDRFEPTSASRMSEVVQWDIQGAGAWYAVIENGTVDVRRGVHGRPSVTISVGADDYLAIVNGEQDGRLVFATGRGSVEGSVLLAMRLESVFPLD